MGTLIKFGLAILSLGLLSQCRSYNQPEAVRISGQAQGTYYIVTYYDDQGRDFSDEIAGFLKDFDMSASLWEPNSVISKINRNDPEATPDPVFLNLFEMSKAVYEKSGGAFDPTIGPLTKAWGFGFSDRLKVTPEIVDSLLSFTGFDQVRLAGWQIFKEDPRMQFDFNAIAQGYSVDLLSDFLSQQGITNYLVDIGGEVLAKGKKPTGERWKVGIEKPADDAEYGAELKAIVELEDMALATSGNYRKFYEQDGMRYSHTIDPKTGYPVTHSLLSVSVLAETCALADAWATAFMVLGLEKSLEVLSLDIETEAYFIYATPGDDELKTFATEGFKKIMVEENI